MNTKERKGQFCSTFLILTPDKENRRKWKQHFFFILILIKLVEDTLIIWQCFILSNFFQQLSTSYSKNIFIANLWEKIIIATVKMKLDLNLVEWKIKISREKLCSTGAWDHTLIEFKINSKVLKFYIIIPAKMHIKK